MQGQFIYGTLRKAGFRVNAFIRNTTRDSSQNDHQEEMQIGLFIFQKGQEIFSNPNYCVIPQNEFRQINESDLPFNGDLTEEYLILVRCTRGSAAGYFPQEHQLNYEGIEDDSKATSVVYDQLPVIPPELAKPRTILLLAPKIWLSKEVNTFVSLPNASPKQVKDGITWEISVLDASGHLMKKDLIQRPENDVCILNIKEFLGDLFKPTEGMQILTLLARGDAMSSAPLTFIKNEKFGTSAVEHSLSPHYYMNGDFLKLRQEAFQFNKKELA